MKAKIYKAKSLEGFEVKGYIYQQPERTRCPIDDYEDISMQTFIIVPRQGDWGLPYSMSVIPIDPYTIEECEEVEIGGVDKISKR